MGICQGKKSVVVIGRTLKTGDPHEDRRNGFGFGGAGMGV
jgi:hypothetical protein